mmetsp:Transcript_15442/g.52080  ORF Transcript_15442/g.52080 Transcript_15442/m.52080 type:complete len:291 (+) Transcript_15442:785-1657(+)
MVLAGGRRDDLRLWRVVAREADARGCARGRVGELDGGRLCVVAAVVAEAEFPKLRPAPRVQLAIGRHAQRKVAPRRRVHKVRILRDLAREDALRSWRDLLEIGLARAVAEGALCAGAAREHGAVLKHNESVRLPARRLDRRRLPARRLESVRLPQQRQRRARHDLGRPVAQPELARRVEAPDEDAAVCGERDAVRGAGPDAEGLDAHIVEAGPHSDRRVEFVPTGDGALGLGLAALDHRRPVVGAAHEYGSLRWGFESNRLGDGRCGRCFARRLRSLGVGAGLGEEAELR